MAQKKNATTAHQDAKQAANGANNSGEGAIKLGKGLKDISVGGLKLTGKTLKFPLTRKGRDVVWAMAVAGALTSAANNAKKEDGLPEVIWRAIEDGVRGTADNVIQGAPDLRDAGLKSWEDVQHLFKKASEQVSAANDSPASPSSPVYSFAQAANAIREDEIIVLDNTQEEANQESAPLRFAAHRNKTNDDYGLRAA